MKVLCDTHSILWWLAGDARLSRYAEEILGDSANQRLVSLISVWEIAIKFQAGRLSASGLTLREIVEQLQQQQFTFLPLRLADLLRLDGLPELHRDLFDRLLLAQAVEENVPMLTADRLMTQYPFPTVW